MSFPEVLIAEDHGIVRLGTTMLIRQLYPQASICEASTLKGALAQLQGKRFDLLILDINIPGGDSVQMIDSIRLRQPDLPILILSSYDENIYAMRFLKVGVNGYLRKESDPDLIKSAIYKVLHGEIFVTSPIQQQLLRSLALNRKDRRPSSFQQLSNRELEIMRLLVKGMSASQIKAQLHLQLSTISTYKARIFEKMEVTNVVELTDKVRLLERGEGESEL